jgi:5-carboxymethyl-2-hydroxymuconate isomerase
VPHCIVEYTDNLVADGRMPALLELLADKFRCQSEVFPVAGLRVRAIRLSEYVLTDGSGEDAFVNITVKIGAGRPLDFRKKFFREMFDIARAHFAGLFASRKLALSLYVEVADPDGSFKTNSARERRGA